MIVDLSSPKAEEMCFILAACVNVNSTDAIAYSIQIVLCNNFKTEKLFHFLMIILTINFVFILRP